MNKKEVSLMTTEKTSPSFCPTITSQTKDGATVEIGSIAPDFSVKIFPGVNFADLAHNTILGSEDMHITTGCIDLRKFRSELDK